MSANNKKDNTKRIKKRRIKIIRFSTQVNTIKDEKKD